MNQNIVALMMTSILFVGCGDDGAAPATADAGPVSSDDFRSAVPALLCEKIAACCDAPPLASCEADVKAKLDDIFARLSASVVFFPEEAGACLAALRAIPEGCDPLVEASLSYRPACSRVIHGTVQPGDPCNGPEECEVPVTAQGNGATGFAGCAILGGEGEQRCRRFNPTGNVGDSCERGFDGTEAEVNLCVPTLSCSNAKMCEEKPTLGQACPQNDCVDSVCEGALCVAGAGEGESCASARCALGLACDASMICRAPSEGDAYVGVCLGARCVDSVCPSS